MPTEQGYNNQKKLGTAQFKTIQNTGSQTFGSHSITKSVFPRGQYTISSSTPVLSKNGKIEFYNIEITDHKAVEGDLLRVLDEAYLNIELSIEKVIDSNNFYVLPVYDFLTNGTFVEVMGWVTSTVDAAGNPNVTVVATVSPTPISYNEDGSQVSVNEDTTDPSSSLLLPVSATMKGFVDENNSSTTPLLAGQSFTGQAFEVTDFSVVNVCVYSDVPSAVNGVAVEFSTDGVNWDHQHGTTYSSANGVGYIFNLEYKYARVVYTNNPDDNQTTFRLQTIFKTSLSKSSLYTIDQEVYGTMFAELGKTTIIGKTTSGGGAYVDVKVNPSGALTVESTVESLPVSYDIGNSDAETQRVVIATDQPPLPVSATVTGGATEAKQDSQIALLQNLDNRLAGSIIPETFDEIVMTYVGTTSDIDTVTYKLSSVTVATVTMTYDGNSRLIGVVRS